MPAVLVSVFLVAACFTAGFGGVYNGDLYSDDMLLQNQYQWLKNQGYYDYNDAMASDSSEPDDDDRYPAYGAGYDTAEDQGDWGGERDDESSEEDDGGYERDDVPNEPNDFIEKETQLRSNDLRDPEKIQQSSLWGTHSVSGGAGEGRQHLKPNGEEENKQEVKSDATLPAYCEPPNPCPKGYGEDKNCLKDVEDTAEYNRKHILNQQESGVCACDSEHMKHCPANQPKIDTKQDASADLEAILENEHHIENPYVKGNKRDTLTAKKRPAKRSKRVAREANEENNPFLEGQKLNIAAKKSPHDDSYRKWAHLEKMIQEGGN